MGQQSKGPHLKQHKASGELIRWWKAIPVPAGTANASRDGFIFIEQDIDAAAKFLISNTATDYESKEFGLIRQGTLQISAFPDWARFNKGDRIVLLGAGRVQSSRATLIRAASGTEDDLIYTPVKSITAAYVNGVAKLAATYEATDTGIEWLSSAPAAGAEYVVEYEFYPRYIVKPNRERTSPTDKNGVSLPLHYWLDLELRTGDDEILE